MAAFINKITIKEDTSIYNWYSTVMFSEKNFKKRHFFYGDFYF